ncbi:hypothetical protein IIA95_03055, partial [Patescibacteria group bacterium]|nr:hypothetical protein [Patescibacteria group bacterium]
TTPSLLQEYADRILVKCAPAPSHRQCYDEEIPKLMDFISMEDAFKVTKLIQNNDDTYWFCHVLAHSLSGKEVAKDPVNWKEVVTRCPRGMCSNGCIHGALQKHFSSASVNNIQLQELMPDLQTICEKRQKWNPTPKEQTTCYHELGHFSLYLTNVDINKSVEICNIVGLKKDGRNYLQTCYEGIFMQIFFPWEPEDLALIYDIIPRKEKLTVCEKYTSNAKKRSCWRIGWQDKETALCNRFTGDIRKACLRQTWIINQDKIKTAEGIIKFCSYSEEPAEKRKCYNKLYYAVMSIFDFDEERMKKICISMPQEIRGQCFANTASRMVETDKRLIERAIDICTFAATFGVEKECYDELLFYAAFVFHPDSEEFLKLCKGLPDPWSKKCLKQGPQHGQSIEL